MFDWTRLLRRTTFGATTTYDLLTLVTLDGTVENFWCGALARNLPYGILIESCDAKGNVAPGQAGAGMLMDLDGILQPDAMGWREAFDLDERRPSVVAAAMSGAQTKYSTVELWSNKS